MVSESGAEMWRPRPKQIRGSALPRKTSKLQHNVDRTANRHRCSGRVAQGERVRGPQGTRQKSDRTLAIRSALSAQAGGAAVKISQATVYQKHSSLQTRKWKYRGRCLTNAGRPTMGGTCIYVRAGLYKPRSMSAITIIVLRSRFSSKEGNREDWDDYG